MIELSEATSFAKGKTRRCYVHPDDPNQCLKVAIIRNRKRRFRLRRFLRPRSWYDPNNSEHRAHRSLERLCGETARRHIPRCYGFVETDLGRALSVEMMRDADGSISRPLPECLKDGVNDTLRAAFAELTSFMSRTGFYVRHTHNILVVREADGGARMVLAEFKRIRSLPARVLSSEHSRHMRRKIERLNDRFHQDTL